jgi:hypothetical protein
MLLLFTVVDPRGITISCSEQQWQEHVLLNHPFMEKRLDDVINTLQRPFLIFADSLKPDTNCYYQMHVKNNRYMKVIVVLRTKQKAELITAYPTDSGKKGETLIWPLSKD